MSQHNRRQTSVSQEITRYAVIFSVVSILLCGVIGMLTAPGVTLGMSRGIHENAQIIGFFAGLLIGVFVGMFFFYLLRGFAVIVAWFEAVPPGFTGVIRPGTGAARTAHQSPAVPGREPAADFGGRWKCRLCGSIQPNIVSVCPRCGNAHVRFTAPPPSRNEKKNAHPSGPASSAR